MPSSLHSGMTSSCTQSSAVSHEHELTIQRIHAAGPDTTGFRQWIYQDLKLTVASMQAVLRSEAGCTPQHRVQTDSTPAPRR